MQKFKFCEKKAFWESGPPFASVVVAQKQCAWRTWPPIPIGSICMQCNKQHNLTGQEHHKKLCNSPKTAASQGGKRLVYDQSLVKHP